MALMSRTAGLSPDLDARAVANALWSVGKIGVPSAAAGREGAAGGAPPLEHLTVLFARAADLAATFNPTDVSNTVWAAATLEDSGAHLSAEQSVPAAVFDRVVATATAFEGKEPVAPFTISASRVASHFPALSCSSFTSHSRPVVRKGATPMLLTTLGSGVETRHSASCAVVAASTPTDNSHR
jgi:hypothetical protein